MASITKTPVKSAREFIGRAWINTVQKEGPTKGIQYYNLQIDNAISEITLKPTDKLQLWPNNKREGTNDADFRLSIVTAEAASVPTQQALV